MQIGTTKTIGLHIDGDVELCRIDETNLNSHTGKRTTYAIAYVVKRGDETIWERQIEDGKSTPAYRSNLAFFNQVTGRNDQPMI